jgi:nicotinate-nucleotide adenylyltransferase
MMPRGKHEKANDAEAPITPPPVPADVDTVVVFGGSFDPPHVYHTIAPLSITMRLFGERGWLLYVPTAKSPLKPHGPIATDSQRLAMLKLALDIPGRRSIWTDEIDRAGWEREHGGERPSYTVDTLRRLKASLPKRVRLRLLIGGDQAASFHLWKNPRRVIRMAEPLVMAREGVVTVNQLYGELPDDFWTRDERASWCRCMAPNFPMTASSSSIRDRIPAAPRNPERWDGVITAVAEYIIKHRLYGFGSRKPKPWRKKLSKDQEAEAAAWSFPIKMALKRLDSKAYPRKASTKPMK